VPGNGPGWRSSPLRAPHPSRAGHAGRYGLDRIAEFDVGFAGVLWVVAEIDDVLGAKIRAALAAQRLGVHGNRYCCASPRRNVLVIGGRFT